MKVNIIADSSSTRTEWAMVEGDTVIERAITTGLNPYFQSRREISHVIRLELPDSFFRRRWNHIYFYGAGCNSEQKNKIVEMSVVAQFKTPVSVHSNLLGAARGLLGDRPGLACILGTGSNSCLYDGENIIKTVPPLGYLLGDEGSNAYIGKRFVADVLRGIAPSELSECFFKRFDLTSEEVLDRIYSKSLPSSILSEFSSILADHLDLPYVDSLIYNSFIAFFERNISFYDYGVAPISFVGSTAVNYKDILTRAANDFGASVRDVCASSLPGLIKYHSNNKR